MHRRSPVSNWAVFVHGRLTLVEIIRTFRARRDGSLGFAAHDRGRCNSDQVELMRTRELFRTLRGSLWAIEDRLNVREQIGIATAVLCLALVAVLAGGAAYVS